MTMVSDTCALRPTTIRASSVNIRSRYLLPMFWQFAMQHSIFRILSCISEMSCDMPAAVWNGLNNTKYLLVDFLYSEPADHILKAMVQILNHGYTPVLAHAERYEDFQMSLYEVELVRSWGVIIQIDAQSILGGLGHGAKRRSRRILKMQMADLVASDAHDLKLRPPLLRECCDFIEQRYGKTYAKSLLLETPLRILRGDSIYEQEG